ncbi:MAG: HAD-IA family hydrolase, partial [Bacteroidota bacterium]
EDPLTFSARYSGYLGKDILADIREKFGYPLDEAYEQKIMREMEKDFDQMLVPVSGMPELVRTLPLPTSVVSNSQHHHVMRSLDLTGLQSFFSQTFSKDMVEHGKPAPDLYLLALKSLKLKPTEAMVIEDSEAGVQAAKAAGLEVIGFLGASHISEGHGERLLQKGADHIAENAADLARLLEHRLDFPESTV